MLPSLAFRHDDYVSHLYPMYRDLNDSKYTPVILQPARTPADMDSLLKLFHAPKFVGVDEVRGSVAGRTAASLTGGSRGSG